MSRRNNRSFATRMLVLPAMAAALAVLPLAAQNAGGSDQLTPEVIFVRNATIWTQGPDGTLEGADLVIRNGKIDKIGKNLREPGDAFVIDGTGKHVTPGLIDAHSHTAIRGGVNEGTNNVTAEVRIEDVLDPTSIDIYRQLAGGLTAAHSLHGSANAIGGQDAVIKLKWGVSREELLIEGASPGIKFALGENPKRSGRTPPRGEPARYPATRMGVMESIRERFQAATDYMRVWETYEGLSDSARAGTAPPRRDLQLDAIAEILRGERVVHSHSYRQDEILALVRLCDEYGVTIRTFQHVLEGYKVADELAAHGAGGSTFSDWWAYKLEAYDAIPYNGALMHERGVLVTFNSDSSELARRMNLEAAKAVRYGGVDPVAALNFVTLNAAIQLGVDDRIGSLEKKKDGDFVVWSGDPLSVFSIVESTWIEGVRQFDRETDLGARDAIAADRAELIERIKNGDKKKDDEGEGADEKGDDKKADDKKADDEKAEKQEPTQEDDADTPPRPADRPLPYSHRMASLAPPTSIVHATVHTVSGDVIEDGTVSFRGGRIVEVGAGLAPLSGATVIDATGRHVFPGMIDANTAVGLTEVARISASVDVAETGDINPDVNTAIAVNPDSELIGVTRAAGITHVLSVPSGGLISGSSSLTRLEGWTWEDLAAARPVAMHVQWPSFRAPRFGGSSSAEDRKREREARIKELSRWLADARAYSLATAAGDDGGTPIDIDPKLAALVPLIDGTMPVFIHADEIRQLKSAIAWAEKEGLRFVLVGSGDFWRIAETLKEKQIPVLLTEVLALPQREDEPYDIRYTEAARLYEAGVSFGFASGGSTFGAAHTRGLPQHAAMAAAFGLPHDAAIAALTLETARIIGVGAELGSIEVGKSASLIVTDGTPLEIRTQIERLFIDGREVDPLANRHHRLYERYRGRPRVVAGGS